MDLCNIQEVRALLGRHGFHFSKSLGQNFLIQSCASADCRRLRADETSAYWRSGHISP